MNNPYEDPLAERSGNTLELLASLTPKELKQNIAYYQWRRVNESFPNKPKSMYKSKSYFNYRTSQFIYDAQKLLADDEQNEPTKDWGMGMSKSARKRRKCPTCQRLGAIRTIIYGMPLGPPDESKYVLGGCVIDEIAPRYRCIKCDALIL